MAEVAHEDYESIELKSRYSLDDHDLDTPGQAVSRSLLRGDSSESNSQDTDIEAVVTRKRATPVPKMQVLTLCAVRIVDPIR